MEHSRRSPAAHAASLPAPAPTTGESSGSTRPIVVGVALLSILCLALIPAYYVLEVFPAFSHALVEDKEIAAGQIATHLIAMISGRHDAAPTLDTSIVTPQLRRIVAESCRDFGLVKIKLFSPEGRVVFSTDPADIGKVNTHAYFREEVMQGRRFSKLVRKTAATLEEQHLARDVVETYVPIMVQGRFLGAFELYYDVTDTLAATRRRIGRSRNILLAVAGLLVLGLAFVTRRAVRSIQRREAAQESLRAANAELALLFDIARCMSDFEHETDVMLHKTLALLCRFSGLPITDRAAIFVSEKGMLQLAASHNLIPSRPIADLKISVGECRCGKAAATGTLTVVDHCTSPCRCFVFRDECEHGHIILPIKVRGQILGVLTTLTPPFPAVDERGKRLLAAVAHQLAISIANHRNFRRANRLSLTDPLTGLPNRRNMQKFLTEQITIVRRYAKSLAVAMLDIDFFKKYNDTYGHQAGDQVLIQVAGILRRQLRRSDLPARYGGEEFIVILPETEGEPACCPMDRIRRLVEKETPVTVSIGIACYHDDLAPEELVELADQALYQAKEGGRNRLVRAKGCSCCDPPPPLDGQDVPGPDDGGDRAGAADGRGPGS